MLSNSRLSAILQSCSNEPRSAVAKLQWALRRINASTRCWSDEFVKLHRALDAYYSLTTTTDLYTTCCAASSMPWTRMTFSAYMVCTHELMTVLTCSDTLKLLVTVTPRILLVVYCLMHGIGEGGCTRTSQASNEHHCLCFLVSPPLISQHMFTFLIKLTRNSRSSRLRLGEAAVPLSSPASRHFPTVDKPRVVRGLSSVSQR